MQQCRAITRKSASNLALAFVVLPRAKRDAMSALYAFCREVDDVADNDDLPVAQRQALLETWRQDIRRACDGHVPELPVNGELQPIIARYRLPYELFDELIRGCEMDLQVCRYDTFAALEQYCHRVASVVGLLSIEIFGYRNPVCRDYAVALGQALQLTNILRDVQTDARRNRIYLPLEALRRHGVPEEDLLRGQYSERFYALARKTAARARGFYRQARETLPAEDRRAMVAAELMGAVYWRLLLKLEAHQFDVFQPGLIRLSTPHKLRLILRTAWRSWVGSSRPHYGTA